MWVEECTRPAERVEEEPRWHARGDGYADAASRWASSDVTVSPTVPFETVARSRATVALVVRLGHAGAFGPVRPGRDGERDELGCGALEVSHRHPQRAV